MNATKYYYYFIERGDEMLLFYWERGRNVNICES